MTEQDKKDIQDILDIIQKSLDEETIDGDSIFTDEVKICAYTDCCKYTRRAYNKAIDDFCEAMDNDMFSTEWVKIIYNTIAEKLKKGVLK